MLALQSQLGNADGSVVFSHLAIFEITIIEKILNYPVLNFELNLTEFLTAIILIKEQYENQAKIVHAFSELDRTLEKVNIGISLISY